VELDFLDGQNLMLTGHDIKLTCWFVEEVLLLCRKKWIFMAKIGLVTKKNGFHGKKGFMWQKIVSVIGNGIVKSF